MFMKCVSLVVLMLLCKIILYYILVFVLQVQYFFKILDG